MPNWTQKTNTMSYHCLIVSFCFCKSRKEHVNFWLSVLPALHWCVFVYVYASYTFWLSAHSALLYVISWTVWYLPQCVMSQADWDYMVNLPLTLVSLIHLTPFQCFDFLKVDFVPLTSRESQQYCSLKDLELIQQLWDSKNMMCDADSRHSFYVASMFQDECWTKRHGIMNCISIYYKAKLYIHIWW